MADAPAPGMPQPDPALKRLDRLVGSWSMKGHFVGSDDENNIIGRTTFSWLPGGFFLRQDFEMDFAGTQIKSLELIGYDRESGAFSSFVYSNLSPDPLPYKWDLRDDTLSISVSYGPMDARFEGKFSEDGKSFSGGWRANPGADPAMNPPYDIGGTRTE